MDVKNKFTDLLNSENEFDGISVAQTLIYNIFKEKFKMQFVIQQQNPE